jgi:hypothetical protein
MDKKLEKARKSFDSACGAASRCRHEKYQVSCASCGERESCDIQVRVGKAKATMDSEKITRVALDTPGKRVEDCRKNIMKAPTCMACPRWETCPLAKEYLENRVQIGNDEEQF